MNMDRQEKVLQYREENQDQTENDSYNINCDSNNDFGNLIIDATKFENGKSLTFTGCSFKGELSFIKDSFTQEQPFLQLSQGSSLIFDKCKLSLYVSSSDNLILLLDSSKFIVRNSILMFSVIVDPTTYVSKTISGLDLALSGFENPDQVLPSSSS